MASVSRGTRLCVFQVPGPPGNELKRPAEERSQDLAVDEEGQRECGWGTEDRARVSGHLGNSIPMAPSEMNDGACHGLSGSSLKEMFLARTP